MIEYCTKSAGGRKLKKKNPTIHKMLVTNILHNFSIFSRYLYLHVYIMTTITVEQQLGTPFTCTILTSRIDTYKSKQDLTIQTLCFYEFLQFIIVLILKGHIEIQLYFLNNQLKKNELNSIPKFPHFLTLVVN